MMSSPYSSSSVEESSDSSSGSDANDTKDEVLDDQVGALVSSSSALVLSEEIEGHLGVPLTPVSGVEAADAAAGDAGWRNGA